LWHCGKHESLIITYQKFRFIYDHCALNFYFLRLLIRTRISTPPRFLHWWKAEARLFRSKLGQRFQQPRWHWKYFKLKDIWWVRIHLDCAIPNFETNSTQLFRYHSKTNFVDFFRKKSDLHYSMKYIIIMYNHEPSSSFLK
jgi:hypothetical protein